MEDVTIIPQPVGGEANFKIPIIIFEADRSFLKF